MQVTETSDLGDLVGGDLIRGHGLGSSACTRDATHVKYLTHFSRWKLPGCNGFSVTEVVQEVTGYGRIEQFIVFETGFLQEMTEAHSLPRTFNKPIVVATLLPIPQTIHHPSPNLIEYQLNAGKYATVQFIDVSHILSLVGRVMAHNRTKYVVNRATVVGQMDMLNVTLNPE